MKLAYAILLHHNERQFEWLFDAIYDPGDAFAIHVDKATPERTLRSFESLVGDRPNVLFLPRRRVAWGGWSLAAVSLESIRRLLDVDDGWDYFINLSGQDYPLRPVDRIRAELARNPAANYITADEIDSFPPDERYFVHRRKRWRCIEFGGRTRRIPVPNLGRPNVRIDWKGSGWYALSRDFCEWIFSDALARDCIAAVRRTFIPDEFLMQTLALNGPFADTVTFDDRREADWVRGRPHPETLTMRHLDRLTSSNAFFARKFDESVDAKVLAALARRIGAPHPD